MNRCEWCGFLFGERRRFRVWAQQAHTSCWHGPSCPTACASQSGQTAKENIWHSNAGSMPKSDWIQFIACVRLCDRNGKRSRGIEARSACPVPVWRTAHSGIHIVRMRFRMPNAGESSPSTVGNLWIRNKSLPQTDCGAWLPAAAPECRLVFTLRVSAVWIAPFFRYTTHLAVNLTRIYLQKRVPQSTNTSFSLLYSSSFIRKSCVLPFRHLM